MLDSSSQLAKSTKPKEARTPFCLSWSSFPVCSRSNPLGQMLMFCTLDTEMEGGLDLSRIIPWGVYSEPIPASNSSLLSLMPCLLHTPVTPSFLSTEPRSSEHNTHKCPEHSDELLCFALWPQENDEGSMHPSTCGSSQVPVSSPPTSFWNPKWVTCLLPPTKSKDVFIILLTTKNMCGVGCEPGWPRSPV